VVGGVCVGGGIVASSSGRSPRVKEEMDSIGSRWLSYGGYVVVERCS